MRELSQNLMNVQLNAGGDGGGTYTQFDLWVSKVRGLSRLPTRQCLDMTWNISRQFVWTELFGMSTYKVRLEYS